MPEEIGIVMSLRDKVSSTLKSIGSNTKAFDKTIQELEDSVESYERAQESMEKDIVRLKGKLTESSAKVKEATAEWRKHKDEIGKKRAMEDAIRDQTKLQNELRDSEALLKSNRKAFVNYYDTVRKEGNRGESLPSSVGLSGGDGILAGLGKAGLYKLVGESLAGAGSALIGSALGTNSDMSAMVSSTLSGIASGAAIGTMVGGPAGTAIGAGVGALAGAINGGTQVFTKRDDAFKGYVQEQTEGQLAQRAADISAGSDIAAGRQQTRMAFSTLLGSDAEAGAYLEEVKAMAAKTNYTYDQITGYTKSLLNSFSPEEILGVLGKLSDASAGLSLGTEDVNSLISGMSRMRLTGKATEEYLNFFTERGFDTYGAIASYRTAQGKKTDERQVKDLVSKGKISGDDAVNALLEYMGTTFAGLSDKLSQSYTGLADNLGDMEDDLKAAYGEGYNAERSKGIKDQMEWLEGASGMAQEEANKALGAWQASLENSKEKYVRDAVTAAMTEDEDYQTAKASGNAAEMGRIIAAAKVKGISEYNANEGADEALAAELSLAATIRDHAAGNKAYWDAGYRKGEEYSKGLADRMARDFVVDYGGIRNSMPSGPVDYSSFNVMDSNAAGFAYGLDRVPRDNFPALLHQGERVLTASQARQQDGGSGVSLQITGPVTIREEADLGKLAQRFAQEVLRAKTLKAPS